MGSNSSTLSQASIAGIAEFRHNQWNKVNTRLRRSVSIEALHAHEPYQSQNIYEWVFSDSGYFVEEYQYPNVDQNTIRDLIWNFKWRNDCPQLVQVLLLKTQEPQGFCEASHSLKVYTEHIPLRLSKVNDIPFPENLYVLKQSLLGFRQAYRMYNELAVQEDQICITSQSKVKVWINADLVSITPSGCKTLKTQAKIVSAIIQLISLNTEHILEPVDIREFLSNKQRKLTFKGALDGIAELARMLRVRIPDRLHSARILFENGIELSTPKASLVIRTQEDSCAEDTSLVQQESRVVQFIPLLSFGSHEENVDVSITSRCSDNCSTTMTPQNNSQAELDYTLSSFANTARTGPTRIFFLPKIVYEKQQVPEESSLEDGEASRELINPPQTTTHPYCKLHFEAVKGQTANFVPEGKSENEWFYYTKMDEKQCIDPQIAKDLGAIVSGAQ